MQAIAKISYEKGSTTYRDLAVAVGIRSTSSVYARVMKLEKAGLVKVGPHIRLTMEGAIGMVAAPIEREFHVFVRVDPAAPDPVQLVVTPLQVSS